MCCHGHVQYLHVGRPCLHVAIKGKKGRERRCAGLRPLQSLLGPEGPSAFPARGAITAPEPWGYHGQSCPPAPRQHTHAPPAARAALCFRLLLLLGPGPVQPGHCPAPAALSLCCCSPCQVRRARSQPLCYTHLMVLPPSHVLLLLRPAQHQTPCTPPHHQGWGPASGAPCQPPLRPAPPPPPAVHHQRRPQQSCAGRWCAP
jgi:hypothetical protein